MSLLSLVWLNSSLTCSHLPCVLATSLLYHGLLSAAISSCVVLFTYRLNSAVFGSLQYYYNLISFSTRIVLQRVFIFFLLPWCNSRCFSKKNKIIKLNKTEFRMKNFFKIKMKRKNNILSSMFLKFTLNPPCFDVQSFYF